MGRDRSYLIASTALRALDRDRGLARAGLGGEQGRSGLERGEHGSLVEVQLRHGSAPWLLTDGWSPGQPLVRSALRARRYSSTSAVSQALEFGPMSIGCGNLRCLIQFQSVALEIPSNSRSCLRRMIATPATTAVCCFSAPGGADSAATGP
jgi:hypothetical protein